MSHGLRARKKEQTRVAITAAALELFERNGFDATTVEEIAEAANVSSRTFFRYFDSKIDVVFPHGMEPTDDDDGIDCAPGGKEALADLVDQRPASEGPIEAAHNVVLERMQQLFEEDGLDVVLRQLRIVMANPTLRSLAVEHSREERGEMVTAFAKRMHKSPDELAPRVLAAAFAETTWVIMEQWVAEGADPSQLTVMLDEAFTLLQRGAG